MAQSPDHSHEISDVHRDTAPVLIDDQKKAPGFEMTRCVYLAVDYDGLETDWFVGQPLASRILLSEFAGIITAPEEGGLFITPEQIDRIFEQLENDNEQVAFDWVVEFEDLWIPNSLVEVAIGKPAKPAGTVLRVDSELVRTALRFSREQITQKQYFGVCNRLQKPVRASPEETTAFAEWGREVFKQAKEDYDQKVEVGEVLCWRDAEGNIYLGNRLVEESGE